ncbi:hypothetical protein [Rummeliibacillus pycnus]|uniref:hypothetical protein n=1 Tax=Rummeliibacillus pycnus TaxID=101070 RepID=UPI003D2B0FC6
MRTMTIDYSKQMAKTTNKIAELAVKEYNAVYGETDKCLKRGGSRRPRNAAEQRALDGFTLK